MTVIRVFLLALLLSPIMVTAQLPDELICAHIARYFAWNKLQAELICSEIFTHPTDGNVLKVTINSRRTRKHEAVLSTLKAASAVANIAGTEIDLLWVELRVDYKETQTIMAIADSECTINAIILESVKPDTWWSNCVQIYPEGSLPG